MDKRSKILLKAVSMALMLLVLLAGFASCKPGGVVNGDTTTLPSDTTVTPDTTVPDKPVEPISIAGFKLIRAKYTDSSVKEAAELLQARIKSVCSLDLAINTDDVSAVDAEILIGNTNRRTTDIDLRKDDFRIVREGNKIYLLAGSQSGVANAVNYFVENYLVAGGAAIEDKTVKTVAGDYEIDSIKLGAAEIRPIKLFTDIKDINCVPYVNRLTEFFEEQTGLKPIRVSSEGEANVLFRTERGKLAGNEYGMYVEGGKLYIVGEYVDECKRAVEYIEETFKAAGGSVVLEEGKKYVKEQISREDFFKNDNLVVYPEFPSQINRDYTYSVSVTQGDKTEKLTVYNHCMESNMSRNSDGTDSFRRFSTFAFSGSRVRVDIKVQQDFSYYSVLPSSKKFEHEFNDGVISVYLDKPEYFMIRLDNSDNTILSVFADEPEFAGDINRDDPNIMIVEGWYEPETNNGVLEINKDNTIIYIAPGAVLNARLRINARNCKVIGRGAIVDPFENVYEENGFPGFYNNLLVINGDNCIVDGIFMLDSRTFNAVVNGKRNTGLKNMKILSTMVCTDGISIHGGKNTSVEHCFIYVGDNGIVFSANEATLRDITIGTTCAAIFPQGSPTNCTFEDIHVFRADDGVINNWYNEGKPTTASVIINRISAVDCTYIPSFFEGGNQGGLEKIYEIRDVSLPAGGHQLFLLKNNDSNYRVSFINVSINGKVIDSIKEAGVGGVSTNHITYSKEGSFEQVIPNKNQLNYFAPGKVLIGNWQVMLEHPMEIKDDGPYLPYVQMKNELRTEKTADTVKINGVDYVNAEALVSSGMAASFELIDGVLCFTAAYDGENILLKDSGEISNFTAYWENKAPLFSKLDENGNTVITVDNGVRAVYGGFKRVITEDIKKYGTGTYKLSFKAKGTPNGQLFVNLEYKGALEPNKYVDITSEWTDVEFTFTVGDTEVNDKMVVLAVYGVSGATMSEICFSDITLVKVN